MFFSYFNDAVLKCLNSPLFSFHHVQFLKAILATKKASVSPTDVLVVVLIAVSMQWLKGLTRLKPFRLTHPSFITVKTRALEGHKNRPPWTSTTRIHTQDVPDLQNPSQHQYM